MSPPNTNEFRVALRSWRARVHRVIGQSWQEHIGEGQDRLQCAWVDILYHFWSKALFSLECMTRYWCDLHIEFEVNIWLTSMEWFSKIRRGKRENPRECMGDHVYYKMSIGSVRDTSPRSMTQALEEHAFRWRFWGIIPCKWRHGKANSPPHAPTHLEIIP